MSQPLPPATADSTPTPPVFSLESLWNSRPVQVVLALGGLGFAIFAIKQLADASPSPQPEKKTEPLSPELIRFISEQHKSKLRFGHRMVCINESKPLPFEKFAEGFIRFKAADLNLQAADEFLIRCYENKNDFIKIDPFFEQTVATEEDLEFFIPNLPLGETVKIEFGKKENLISLILKIDQPRGFYTLFKENYNFIFKVKPVSSPISHAPISYSHSQTLTRSKATPLPLSIVLSDDNQHQITDPIEGSTSYLTIRGCKKKSVVYLQFTTPKLAFAADQKDIVIPFVISAGKVKTISRDLLDRLWKRSFQWATSKEIPQGDLALQLAGLQQIIYSEPNPFVDRH